MRRRIGAALMLLIGVALWLSALAAAQALAASCVEMRWDDGDIGAEALELALENAESPVRAALYGQGRVSGKLVCWAAGDLTLLAGSRVLYGHMNLSPGECAVSLETARELLGADDVRGRTIQVDGGEMVVRGVYAHGQGDVIVPWVKGQEEKMNRLLASAGDWPLGDSLRRAQDFAASLGLSGADQALDMPLLDQLAQTLAMLPGWVLAIWLVAWQVRGMRRGHKLLRGAALAASLAAMAWTLGAVAPPSYLLPTRWSDFAFWEQLVRGLAGRVRETLAAQHYALDQARTEALALAGVLAIAAAHLLAGGFGALTKKMEE